MGNGNKAEMLIAICAVITSIAAVFIAWDQARVMRSQEKADVWPILQITHQTDYRNGSARYSLDIQNAGVGPALIDDYIIAIPHEGVTQNLPQMVEYLFGEHLQQDFGMPIYTNLDLKGRVLRQGDMIFPISANWLQKDGLDSAMAARVKAFTSGAAPAADVYICYCSILDDCWVSSTSADALRPLSIKSCSDLSDFVGDIASTTEIPSQTSELTQ